MNLWLLTKFSKDFPLYSIVMATVPLLPDGMFLCAATSLLIAT